MVNHLPHNFSPRRHLRGLGLEGHYGHTGVAHDVLRRSGQATRGDEWGWYQLLTMVDGGVSFMVNCVAWSLHDWWLSLSCYVATNMYMRLAKLKFNLHIVLQDLWLHWECLLHLHPLAAKRAITCTCLIFNNHWLALGLNHWAAMNRCCWAYGHFSKKGYPQTILGGTPQLLRKPHMNTVGLP